MHENSTIEIDLAAIGRNMRLLRTIVGPDVKICPMVKADAYGLGAVRISKTLVAAGADMLAVYTSAQAMELFNSAIGSPILVLMPIRDVKRTDDLYRGLICGRLHLTVHDEDQLRDLIALAERFGAAIPVHLEVDTGMSRGGCLLQDAPRLLETIAAHPRLKLAGLFTHFSSAEHDMGFTDEQHTRFGRLLDEHAHLIPQDCLIHEANTFATMRGQRFHRSMVRLGLAWAGYCLEEMSNGEFIVEGEQLEPAIRWTSRLIQIKHIAAGTSVGYGSRWRAGRDSVIGLVPVGYADGYPIGAGNRASVRLFLGSSFADAPVIGAVNMDQISIDLTEAAAAHGPELAVGTRVELITPDRAAPNHLPHLADQCGTFAHEMICRLNSRLRRGYKTITPSEIRAAVVA